MKSRWWWNLCERLLDFVPSGRSRARRFFSTEGWLLNMLDEVQKKCPIKDWIGKSVAPEWNECETKVNHRLEEEPQQQVCWRMNDSFGVLLQPLQGYLRWRPRPCEPIVWLGYNLRVATFTNHKVNEGCVKGSKATNFQPSNTGSWRLHESCWQLGDVTSLWLR